MWFDSYFLPLFEAEYQNMSHLPIIWVTHYLILGGGWDLGGRKKVILQVGTDFCRTESHFGIFNYSLRRKCLITG